MKLFGNSQPISPRQSWAHFTGMSLLLVACLFLVVPQHIADAQDDLSDRFTDATLLNHIKGRLFLTEDAAITQNDLYRLTNLWIPVQGISDLSGLELVTNLTTINLERNQVSDLSPLANLTNLTQIAAAFNQVSDLSPLANLTNLTHLYLAGNRIVDISPLANLTNLEHLDISSNTGPISPGITDYSVIHGLLNLRQVWGHPPSSAHPALGVIIPDAGLRGAIAQAVNVKPTDFISEAHVQSLTRLQINGVRIQNFKGLEKATNLQNLELIDNGGISDITPLAKILVNLTQLRTLGLVNNQIVNVSPLANLTQLTTLALGENQIVDVSPLARLTNLTTLALNNNQIADVSSLASLTNLITLLLHNNQIADFSPLAGLASQLRWYSNGSQVIPSPTVAIPDAELRGVIETTLNKAPSATITQEDMESLTTLQAYGAGIVDLTGLETATNLTFLSLYNNAIVDVSALENLTSLKVLFLNNNQISDVSPLANLTNLAWLFLNNNQIADFSPIADLESQVLWYVKEPQVIPQDSDASAEAEGDTAEAEKPDLNNPKRGVDLNLPGADPICGTAEHVPGTPCIVPAPTEAPALHLHTDINGDGIIDARDVVGIPLAPPPKKTALFANYPNPFNPETWMPYALAKPADVTVSIYAMNGHLVRKLDLGHQAAGLYRSKARAAYWDGRNDFGERVSSGVYFYVFTAGDFAATRKMLILK